MPNLSGRLARWVEKMAEFDYKLQHIPGKDNVVADALSRRADYAQRQPRQHARQRSSARRGRADAQPRARAQTARAARAPEPPELRQRNIDAATKVRRATRTRLRRTSRARS